MVHIVWLTFFDEKLEEEYQREKFGFILQYFYTMCSIAALITFMMGIYYLTLGRMQYSLFGFSLLGFLIVEFLLVHLYDNKLCLLFMMVDNILVSAIPLINMIFKVQVVGDYQSAFLQGSALMMFQYCLLLQPKFAKNALQIISMVLGKSLPSIISDFDFNVTLFIIVGILAIFTLYQKEKSQRELFLLKHKQCAINEHVNETIDYPMMIVRYDEENLKFSLMTSNKSSREEFKINGDDSLKNLMRTLKVDLKLNMEQWVDKRVLINDEILQRYQVIIHDFETKPNKSYKLYIKQLSNFPRTFALIFIKQPRTLEIKKQKVLCKSFNYLFQQFRSIRQRSDTKQQMLLSFQFSFTLAGVYMNDVFTLHTSIISIGRYFNLLKQQLKLRFQIKYYETVETQKINTDVFFLTHIFKILLEYLGSISMSSGPKINLQVFSQNHAKLENTEETLFQTINFVLDTEMEDYRFCSSLLSTASNNRIKPLPLPNSLELVVANKLIRKLGPGKGLKAKVKQSFGRQKRLIIFFSLLQNIQDVQKQAMT